MATAPEVSYSLTHYWQPLVDLGFCVIPIPFRKKKPVIAWKVFQDEKPTMEQVRAWAEGPPSNIGIVTGSISGIVVLDLDSDEAVQEAERRGLPDTPTATTANGRHVYFRHPGGKVGNRAGVLPGWDIRGDGGYVVAPGSVHPSGPAYRWDNTPGLFELADMPTWLVELLAKPEAKTVAPAADNVRPIRTGNAWADAAMRGEIADLMAAPAGKRNAALNTAAMKLGQIVAGMHLDESDVKARLRATATAIGLDAAEIEPTLESGFAKGLTEPRDPPDSRQSDDEKPKRRKRDKSVPIEAHDPETGEVFKVDGDVSEDAIAQAFTDRYRDTLRYDHTARAWFEWDGARWKKDSRDRAFSYARQLGRVLSRGDDGERGLRKASVAGGAERFARADPAHAVDASVWDLDPMLLSTPAGTVDLRTGKMRVANPGDYITRQTAVAPDSGDPTRWLAFLEESLGKDAEAIRFLQQWCGYCLSGLTSAHALLFIYGPGGNGKTVFLSTLATIMGDYAVTAAMETFTASKFDRHSTELAMLAGARLVTASETEEGRAWAEAKVKQMTGGDPITARFMHKDNFTFRPQFKLTIAGNHAPALRNVDDAMRRRFNIIPFTVKPAKPDHQLEEKLRAEHGRILAWAIKGFLDWQENGLVRPTAVTDATADYFDAQDLFGQWIADCCDVGPTKWEQPTPLYNSWCSYAREAGEEPGAMKSFTEGLQKRGFPSKRSHGIRSYRGLAARRVPGVPHGAG